MRFGFCSFFWLRLEALATHSSVLAWRIPGTGEPGGLPSMGSHRVGHDCSNLAAAAAEAGQRSVSDPTSAAAETFFEQVR